MVGRHWFGLCVSVESDLFFSARIEIKRVFVSGRRNRLDVRAGIEIECDFSVGIEICFVLVRRLKLTRFLCGGEN